MPLIYIPSGDSGAVRADVEAARLDDRAVFDALGLDGVGALSETR